ncbi:hypothetical protein H072_4228 [Dactylellina haptotyla CBS 200.50]|uniref:Uncharacterized protein n=1 Tax=Dactylellina haptotyla (strain CBS 200.50) TaxID=1284197 RepID=S8C2J8_DACHA|nr:hypothetical protein H072_4228 [Dactylellina haptotyla CBS 200.50]
MHFNKAISVLLTIASTATAVVLPGRGNGSPALVVRENAAAATPTAPVKLPPSSAKKPGKFGGNSIWAKKKVTLDFDKNGAKMDAKNPDSNTVLAELKPTKAGTPGKPPASTSA